MKIIQVYPRGFGANTYILTADNQNAVVIDPSQPRISAELIKHGLTARFVLLTHCHFDHVGGVETLQQAGARVLCLAQEKSLIGTQADLFERFGAPRIYYKVDQTVQDNEMLTLCGLQIKVLATPGHTQGSTCYLVTAENGEKHLFTGDTLFMDSIGRTDFPSGSLPVLRQSLKRLSQMDDMPVYAGHGEQTTIARECKNNPFMIDIT